MGLNFDPGRTTYSSSESEGGYNAKLGFLLTQGTGLGNYTSASTSYVDVDATNLTGKVIIPVGWVAVLSGSGVLGVNTASAVVGVGLADAGTLLQEQKVQPSISGASSQIGFGLSWVLKGDNKGHSFSLQFKTTNAADSVVLFNDSALHVPTLIIELGPSNF